MPFPPTFTNVWDITQPPDTQLASQGGLDFRNVHVDVMQRMSLLSGTLANRPTPETVNATWGGSGFGVIYIATDTSQIFQWNGASWTEISFLKHLTDLSVNVVNPGPGALNSITIPASGTKIGSHIRITSFFGPSSGTPTTIALELNGTTLYSFSFSAGGGVATGALVCDLLVTSASVAQIVVPYMIGAFNASPNIVFPGGTVAGISYVAANANTFSLNLTTTGSSQGNGMTMEISF